MATVACLAVMSWVSCDVDRQARELRALEKCRYELISADNIVLAGTDISALVNERNIDIAQIPGIALSFLTQEIPLRADLQIRITNPTSRLAGINAFEYQIQVEGKDLLAGVSDSPIRVPANSTVTIPVHINANIFNVLNDKQTIQKVLEFIEGRKPAARDHILLTFKIKPTIALGNTAINYPGFISIDKKVSRSMLEKRQGISL